MQVASIVGGAGVFCDCFQLESPKVPYPTYWSSDLSWEVLQVPVPYSVGYNCVV